MDTLSLIEPTAEYLEQIEDYRNEFLENGDSMDGCSSLRKYENINDWLNWVSLAKKKETCLPTWVPDTAYLCIRKEDNRLVGMIDIRDELNEQCFNYYGHIGYSIRKSERHKYYATEQLALALEICREKNFDKVMITCDKTNIGSAKTIQKNGGVLENEVIDPKDNCIMQRYWITF